MAFLKGHQLWKNRSKHGREKLFSDAALLLEEAYAYFDWCDRYPWEKAELVKYKGEAVEESIPLGRPYTLTGFMVYLGVSEGYYRAAMANIKKKIDENRATEDEIELLDAFDYIALVVKTQQVEGAAVGVFSPGLVARLNGLADTQNVKSSQPVVSINVRDQETAEALDELKTLL